MHRIYLAGATSRAAELKQYAEAIRAYGHTITSRWHEFALTDAQPGHARLTQRDMYDIGSSNWLICFSGWPRRPDSGEAEFEELVEFGIALALGKRVILVGRKPNGYFDLDGMDHYSNFQSLITSVFMGSGPEEQ